MERTQKMIATGVVVLIVISAVYAYFFWRKTDMATTPLTKVSMEMKWLPQSQFAGTYVALEKGYYKTVGLDLSIMPFALDKQPIDSVVNGDVQFAVIGADAVLAAREAGIPVKAIAVIYKTNPVVAYSLTSSGIKTPYDFVGKTIGLKPDIQVLYNAMMNKLGIDRAKTTEVEVGYDASELLSGKVDVSTGYIFNEPQQARDAGKDVEIIPVSNYGVNMYADVLIAREDYILNNRDTVQKFVNATLKGWNYAVQYSDEAVKDTLKYATDSNEKRERIMLTASIPLIHTGESPIGSMEQKDWQEAADILLQQKVLKNAAQVQSAYDNSFVESFYRNQ